MNILIYKVKLISDVFFFNDSMIFTGKFYLYMQNFIK